MPTVYVLVGVPGSGKSTWIKNQEWTKDCAIISTDNHVEEYASIEGKTYSEVFEDFMPQAVKLMADDVLRAREKNMDIIWDQTSTTLASRRRKFNMLPKYDHVAVVFKTPEPEELARRLASRPGKTIPDHVMKRMIEGFDPVELEEGYSEIWYAQ